MQKCKTCKYWCVEDWVDKGWGICKMMTSYCGSAVKEGTQAIAYDHEGCAANTHTLESFSCAMYVMKSEEDQPHATL